MNFFIKLVEKRLKNEDISLKTDNYSLAKRRSEKKGKNYSYDEIKELPHAIEPPAGFVVVDVDSDSGFFELQKQLLRTASKTSPERKIKFFSYKTNRGGHFWFKKPKIKNERLEDIMKISFNTSKIMTYINTLVDYRDNNGYCVLAFYLNEDLFIREKGSTIINELDLLDEMPFYLLPQKVLDKTKQQTFNYLKYEDGHRDDQVFKEDIPFLRMAYQDEIENPTQLKNFIGEFLFEKTKLYHQDKESVFETKKWINEKINSSFKMGAKMYEIKSLELGGTKAIKARPPQRNINKVIINTDIATDFVNRFKFVEQKPFFFLNINNKLQILNEDQVKKTILEFGLSNDLIDTNTDAFILKNFLELVKVIAAENKLEVGSADTICFKDMISYNFKTNEFTNIEMVDLNYLPIDFFDESGDNLLPENSFKKIDAEISFFLSYFNEILGTINFKTLLQALAISMTHNPSFEVFFEWFGPQGTGKSTTQLFFQSILGTHNTISFKIESLVRQFSQNLLFNKLAAFEPDLENVSFYKMAEGQIRTLTSGVPIAAEIKNSNIRQESTPYATLHILTNYTIPSNERRRYLIPFLKVSSKKEFRNVKDRVLQMSNNTKRYFVWRALKELQKLKNGIYDEDNKKIIVQSADVHKILNNTEKIEIIFEFVNSPMFWDSLSENKNGCSYDNIFELFKVYVDTTQSQLTKRYDITSFSRDLMHELSKPSWKNTITFSVQEKKFYFKENFNKKDESELLDID